MILRVEAHLHGAVPAGATVRRLTLPYAARVRSRQRVLLDDGTDAGLVLPRGTALRHGDALAAQDGSVVVVEAAIEEVYAVTAAADAVDPAFDLLRAAYHLGNRHVPVALSPGVLHLERDPVLRELLRGLGLWVTEVRARFEPEAGAYGGGHRHDRDPDGGTLGELLSRQAHAARGTPGAVPDLAAQRFTAEDVQP